tara:strand:- start:477 stop:665 length:189 start_codon:yes stop_codon:yes gene_type:complete
MNNTGENIHIFRLFNTYNDERNINYSDLIEKGLYFDSNNYKDEGYIEIKTVKNTIEFISIKI